MQLDEATTIKDMLALAAITVLAWLLLWTQVPETLSESNRRVELAKQ